MKISLKPQALKRYKEIAQLLIKYGRSDVVQHFRSDEIDVFDKPAANGEVAKPEELARDLERMGPTFVKLGQVLSSRPDLLPEPYLKALARLQDKVKPFPYEAVEKTIHAELGIRISKAFSSFEEEPLAAASLGQVHRATLRDGRPVVVKVQRPGIRAQIAEDMEVLHEIASFLNEHTKAGQRYQILNVFDEFRRSLRQELDYQREAMHMVTLAKNLAEFPGVVIPLPVEDYTTRSVLTMDYIQGFKLTDLSPLVRLDIDGAALADELFKAYLKQVLVDGVFHADPHPGNVFLTQDGRIALLDLGMIGHTSPGMQEKLLRLLLAVSEGKSGEASNIVIQTSETSASFDEVVFRRQMATAVSEQLSNTLQKIDVGKTLLSMARNAGESGLFVPPELTMLGKTLLQIDEIGRYLDPAFDPNDALRRHAAAILNQRVQKDLTPGNLFTSFLELKHFFGHLPGRMNRILDAVANAELELKVRTTDVHYMLQGFQRIANRITTGLILAALIVAASLLMKVETTFEILGYPGFAMILFLVAAGIGFYLVISILVQDHRAKRERELSGE